MSERDISLNLLETARQYTLSLLDGLAEDEWYAMPGGSPSHIAWQIGHITFAQFGLAIARSFGTGPQDEGVLPDNYAELFGKGTQPSADRARYPTVAQLRAALDRVHSHVMAWLRAVPEQAFREPAAEPILHMKTRGDLVRFTALHEMLHAGQIGLIRRLLGKPPLR